MENKIALLAERIGLLVRLSFEFLNPKLGTGVSMNLDLEVPQKKQLS